MRPETCTTVSGEPPENPVVSKKTGNVYEKRVITKYIGENGKEPGTNEELSEDDLLEVNVVPKSVKPRPPGMTSIPAMMAAFQNEWDSIMLETYSLKEKYAQVRQELSHALYQYDAACHVIARLTKERDAAREALASVQAHVGTAPTAKEEGSTAMEVDIEVGLPADVVAKIDETLDSLSKQRRKRKAPKDLTTPDLISKYTATKTIPSLHSASSPGITTMDYDPEKRFIVTGGADRAVGICSVDDEKVVATLKGHTKKVHQVMWHMQDSDAGRAVFSASADKTVRMWTASETGAYSAAHIFKGHKDDVTGLGLHPSGDYLTSASLDSTWSLRDVATGKTLATAGIPEDNGYTCCAVHPDGIIFCSGTSSDVVQIWDIKARTKAASFTGHKGMVTAVAFSENGYLLATASADEAVVKLWDLRKLKTVQTLELGGSTSSAIRSLHFDYSGSYLAAGGMDLRVWKTKGWEELLVREDHTGEVRGVRFGDKAQEIVTASMDRSVIIYSAQE